MQLTRFDSCRPLGLLVKVYPKLSETFILEEILGLERLGIPLRIYALAGATDSVAHRALARVRAPLTVVPGAAHGNARQFALRHLKLLAHAPLRYVRALAGALARGSRGVQDFVRAGWLAVQLRDDGIEHLHTHFISTPADMAELVAQLTGLAFSISAHAKDIYLSDPLDLRRKLGAARFTVTCTEFNRCTLASIAPHAAVHRMYHGVDRDLFHPRRRAATAAPPLLLSVGRLRAKKGLDTLIDACDVLRRRGEEFRCEIIGYGEERERLEARIARYGLTEQVRLTGALTREQVIEAYARATVYVQASRITPDGDRDGIPNVLLEAMAMGLPVVASRVSGIPELISDGHTGVLVDPDQPELLADAVSRLLGASVLRRDLGARAREAVAESFDNDRNLGLLCGLLQNAGPASAVRGRGDARPSRPAVIRAPVEAE